MENTINYIIYFLIHWGVMVIALKYNVKNAIYRTALKIQNKKTLSRLIYDMSECEFCISHHIGIFVIFPVFAFLGFNWYLLAYPFMSASLMNIIKTKKINGND